MELGKILLRKNLATQEQIDQALEMQSKSGGRLGECLTSMGVITQEQLAGILNPAPQAPNTVADTGLSEGELRNLLLKAILTLELQTTSPMIDVLKLPAPIIQSMVNDCVDQMLIEVLGSSASSSVGTELRYGLTTLGKARAFEAMELNLYVGPAPVSLEDYRRQIDAQKITNERIKRQQVESAFEDLVISREFVANVGPAVNSGRSILLYGPPGNGKTSVAERVAQMFCNVVYIPHCIQVDGQIIKVFDPSVHVEVQREPKGQGRSIRRDNVDRRWVPCERPVVVTGGELTLEMLDLQFNPHSRFYEAPLHIKALGGTFIIDDFGRQLVSPEDILNRWIVPLQSRVDFLKLHTGKSFEVPFDELIIFSTNLRPADLMDAAFLRRIPYKLEMVASDAEQFRDIFGAVAAKAGLEVQDQDYQFILEALMTRDDGKLACYQPSFIVEQVLCACKYEDIAPVLRRDLVERAIGNLFAEPSAPSESSGTTAQPTSSAIEGVGTSETIILPAREMEPRRVANGYHCGSASTAVS